VPQRSLRSLGFFASRALGTRITARASRGDATSRAGREGRDAYLLSRHLDLLCVLEAREIKGESCAPAPVFRDRWRSRGETRGEKLKGGIGKTNRE